MNAIQKVPCSPSLGADVEGFLKDTETGHFIPCVGLVPGTKENPHPLDDLPKGFCIQEDNVMVEFNIPPAQNYRQFSKNITVAVRAIQGSMKKNHRVIYKADQKFMSSQLRSKQAQAIGCEPDFDAYTGGTMRMPLKASSGWRGAGGHIHLGGDFQCPDFVAALFCDLSLGIGQNMTGYTKDRRTQFYGMPGIFRPKPYGVEWRSPSCDWINNTEKYAFIGDMGLRLATWFTDTDARDLQTVFRKIDWVQVRSYLMFRGDTPRSVQRAHIIEQASLAGVPL